MQYTDPVKENIITKYMFPLYFQKLYSGLEPITEQDQQITFGLLIHNIPVYIPHLLNSISCNYIIIGEHIVWYLFK